MERINHFFSYAMQQSAQERITREGQEAYRERMRRELAAGQQPGKSCSQAPAHPWLNGICSSYSHCCLVATTAA